jgi:hypothetical protein
MEGLGVLHTVPEAAETTRLSPSWWRKSIFEKRVRYVKLGGRVFIPQATIEKLIASGIVEPSQAHN